MISTCPRCQKQVSIPAGVDPTVLVRCPLCVAEYALSEALAWGPPELIPVGRPVAEGSTSAAHEAAAEPAGPVAAEHVETPHDTEAENEAAAVARQFPGAAATGAQRRRRKHKSALRTLIEVVTGGLAGCLVAYYALAFYYGPEFRKIGLPQLPLPGISWITAPRAGDDATEKPAEKAKKPAKDKTTAANCHSREQDALASRGKASCILTGRVAERL